MPYLFPPRKARTKQEILQAFLRRTGSSNRSKAVLTSGKQYFSGSGFASKRTSTTEGFLFVDGVEQRPVPCYQLIEPIFGAFALREVSVQNREEIPIARRGMDPEPPVKSRRVMFRVDTFSYAKSGATVPSPSRMHSTFSESSMTALTTPPP